MTPVIAIQNVSKPYWLGVIGHGTLREDLQCWWAKVREKETTNRVLVELLHSGKIGWDILEKNSRFWKFVLLEA